jgi:AraC-like DNA-binding protein
MASKNMRKFLHVFFNRSITEQAKPLHFERHCHDTYEILYVVRGSGKYIVEGAEYPLKPNTLLLTKPYEFHYVCPDLDSVYERYVINFDLAAPVDSAAQLSLLHTEDGSGYGIYFSENTLGEAIRAIFAEMEMACEMFSGSPQRAAREETMFRVALTRLLFFLSVEKSKSLFPKEENLAMRVTDYINRNLAEPLSLDALAQRFFVSKYYLCHAFRQQAGVSIFAYINTKRIALAEQLLAKGEPATAVAFAVGFGNYSTFYRAFCKQTGHPPAHKR